MEERFRMWLEDWAVIDRLSRGSTAAFWPRKEIITLAWLGHLQLAEDMLQRANKLGLVQCQGWEERLLILYMIYRHMHTCPNSYAQTHTIWIRAQSMLKTWFITKQNLSLPGTVSLLVLMLISSYFMKTCQSSNWKA